MSRYIDADDVIHRVVMFEELTNTKLDMVHDFISSQPTADVREDVRGEWVVAFEDDRKQISWFECSECQYGVSWQANFCPNCGADMRGDKE